ncbi:hypothetical protein H4582DRAFT_1921722 [Lactarius indigo]|nr:hypothetical protein H4582DRAFT_1921722 [Lactarius indigo]
MALHNGTTMTALYNLADSSVEHTILRIQCQVSFTGTSRGAKRGMRIRIEVESSLGFLGARALSQFHFAMAQRSGCASQRIAPHEPAYYSRTAMVPATRRAKRRALVFLRTGLMAPWGTSLSRPSVGARTGNGILICFFVHRCSMFTGHLAREGLKSSRVTVSAKYQFIVRVTMAPMCFLSGETASNEVLAFWTN